MQSGEPNESIAPGSTLVVTDGPQWGAITYAGDTGWWFKVERPSDGISGWVWQARLEGCREP